MIEIVFALGASFHIGAGKCITDISVLIDQIGECMGAGIINPSIRIPDLDVIKDSPSIMTT